MVDFANKKILGTKASLERASKGTGEAYNQLTALMEKHPTFAVEAQKLNVKKSKQTYKKMTFDFMRGHIENKDDSATKLAEMESIIAFAKENKKSPYPQVKHWFLENYKKDFENTTVVKVSTSNDIQRAVKVRVLKPVSDEKKST